MAISSITRSRATNLTGLIDIDALVEANTIRQKTKINSLTQKMKVEQYKQEQYRAIQTKAKTFYNKYCDVLSSGSFLSSSTYNTTEYTPSVSNIVTATGSSKSNVTNYDITVTQLASKAYTTFSNDSVVSGNQITINTDAGEKKFELKGKTKSEIAANLNSELENAGLKIKARYSDLANSGSGGLIIENSTEGKVANWNVKMTEKQSGTISLKDEISTSGSYATILDKSSLVSGNKIKIGDVEYEMQGSNEQEITTELDSQLSTIGLKASYDEVSGKMKIESINSGDDESNKFTAKLISGDNTTNLTVDLDEGYSTRIDLSSLSSSTGISINNQNFRLKYTGGDIDIDDLNSQLIKVGVEASIDSDNNKFIINSKGTGTSSKFAAEIVSYSTTSEDGAQKDIGNNLKATIKDGSNTYEINDGDTRVNGNAITLDGTTFKFTGTGSTTLTGKRNATELTKKIKDFITDYNELLGAINEKLYETRDKSYMPLTDDDKEGLSDSQIEKLEKKAQEGLLRNDSYLRNFAEDMKTTMSTVFTTGVNSGLSLEKIGIKPVEDYTAQNGLFTVDEDKLKAALEDNPDAIYEFFTGENGIITKLKSNLYDHATGKFSRLSNRAGVANGVTAKTNEMTKDIEARKKIITEMQAALKEREDALYTRYATLESNLSSLQAQQSSLVSYFQ